MIEIIKEWHPIGQFIFMAGVVVVCARIIEIVVNAIFGSRQ